MTDRNTEDYELELIRSLVEKAEDVERGVAQEFHQLRARIKSLEWDLKKALATTARL